MVYIIYKCQKKLTHHQMYVERDEEKEGKKWEGREKKERGGGGRRDEGGREWKMKGGEKRGEGKGERTDMLTHLQMQ